jgi:NADH-quinone oxidoreductase subunit L
MVLLYETFHTLTIETIFSRAEEMQDAALSLFGVSMPTIEVICLLLFVGAMGKSAQLGLHTWLPDAMEGPTPVSALIHAATMVTAGVFLIVRLSHLYEMAPFTRDIMACVGAFTAFFAGTVALTQRDIKRIIAYSTCSQLGYMFLATGVSAYSVAMFHLMTHAFFKALLFLGAGAIIHAMSDEQNIFKMGGIWRYIPFTYATMWIGSLALAGIPIFAGYFSKHALLEAAWFSSNPSRTTIVVLALIVVFLTAFYSWRLLWVVFHGSPRADEKVMGHIHEAPLSMTLPMLMLAIGSILAGLIFNELGVFTTQAKNFWQDAIALPSHPAPHSLSAGGNVLLQSLSIAGILCAILLYGWEARIPAFLAKAFHPLYQFLFHKWYFDEIYAVLFMRPSLMVSSFFGYIIDTKVIDKGGPGNAAALTQMLARRMSRLHTGFIHHYALAMILGLLILLTGYLLI